MCRNDHFWGYVDRTGECWLWTGGKDAKGYGIYHLNGRSVRAHRHAYCLAHGQTPSGLFVLDHCDTPSCVRSDHLYAGTHAQNMADMVSRKRQATGGRHGFALHPERIASGARNGHVTHPERTPKGEAVNLARLTTDQVIEIRRQYATGEISQRRLARLMGISRGAVGSIVVGRTWKHIPCLENSFRARRTHCRYGHLYDGGNTYRTPDGERDCRTCVRERARRYKAKRGAERPVP